MQEVIEVTLRRRSNNGVGPTQTVSIPIKKCVTDNDIVAVDVIARAQARTEDGVHRVVTAVLNEVPKPVVKEQPKGANTRDLHIALGELLSTASNILTSLSEVSKPYTDDNPANDNA